MSFFSTLAEELSLFNFSEISKAFPPLFVTIDILGAIPVVLQLKQRGQRFSAPQVAVYSGIILFILLLAGDAILGALGINRDSFSVAGGMVLFVMAVEMVFGLEIFKEDGVVSNATFVPLVFPLFAGAAAFTTLINLQAEGYAAVNITISIILNMICVYIGLRFVDKVKQVIGDNGSHILRKFFGVVLLAIAAQIVIRGVLNVAAMS